MNKVNIDQIKQQSFRTFYKLNNVNHFGVYIEGFVAGKVNKRKHLRALECKMCRFVAFECRLSLRLHVRTFAFVNICFSFLLIKPTQEPALKDYTLYTYSNLWKTEKITNKFSVFTAN